MNHVCITHPSSLQNSTEVLEHTLRFRFDGLGYDAARFRIDGNLTGTIERFTHQNALAIRTNGCGSKSCLYYRT